MLEQDRLSNSALGAAGGSRIGTKVAMPDADYVNFHAEVSIKSAAAGGDGTATRAGLRVNGGYKVPAKTPCNNGASNCNRATSTSPRH